MKPPKTTHSRASRITFRAIAVLVAFTAAVNIYLELKIHSTWAEIDRLQNSSPGIANTSRPLPAETPDSTDSPTSEIEATISVGSKWFPNNTLLEQQTKQALATIGYDRALVRGAANQIKVRLRFQELYKILGLTRAEIVAFENEAADKNLTFNALVSTDPADIEAHKRSQANSMDRIVADTLGPAYVEPFRLFLKTSDLRSMTAELAVHSTIAGAPLTSEQASVLLHVFTEHRQPVPHETRIDPAQVDWESVSLRAQQFLSPAQQTLLQAMIDRQNFDRTFQAITGLPLHRPIRGLRSP